MPAACLVICRYQRIGRRSQSGSLDSGTPSGTPYLAPTPLASPGQLAAEHAVYADFMRTILEVINTVITTGVHIQAPFAVLTLHSLRRRHKHLWYHMQHQQCFCHVM